MREILIRVASVFGKRNNKRRKGNFLQFFMDKFLTMRYKVEVVKGKEKSNTSQNLFIGNFEKNNTVFMTGYDTSSMLLIPFSYYPLNNKKNSNNNLIDLITRIILAIGIVIFYVYIQNNGLIYLNNKLFSIVLNALVSFLVLALIIGISSPYNFERNTTAITALYQAAVDSKSTRNIAFVYVDKTIGDGAYGYKYLAEENQNLFKDKHVIILDCISNGKDIFVVYKNNATNKAKQLVSLLADNNINAKEILISDEQAKNTSLSNYENSILLTSGVLKNNEIVVRKTRTFFDSNVNIDRVEKITDVLKHFN